MQKTHLFALVLGLSCVATAVAMMPTDYTSANDEFSNPSAGLMFDNHTLVEEGLKEWDILMNAFYKEQALQDSPEQCIIKHCLPEATKCLADTGCNKFSKCAKGCTDDACAQKCMGDNPSDATTSLVACAKKNHCNNPQETQQLALDEGYGANVHFCRQECQNWCWAASVCMVRPLACSNQCQILSQKTGRSCCGGCGACGTVAGSDSDIARFSGGSRAGVLSANQLQQYTGQGRGVVALIQWSSGGGHAIVVNRASGGSVNILDPMGGGGSMSWQSLMSYHGGRYVGSIVGPR